METKIPDWLTVGLLKHSLQRDRRYRDITVNKFTASLAAPAGNNYGSLVFRVDIDCDLGGVEQKLSIVIKGPLTEGIIGDVLKEINNTEPSFYNVFLPEAYKLLPDRFAPDSFQSSNPSVVILEDLKISGYLMADRTKQLDFDHCLLYTNAAAAFHATSIALLKRNPDMIGSVTTEPLYKEECKLRSVMEKMFKWGLECMADRVPDKRISRVLNNLSKHIWSILVDIHKPHPTLNSLLQGDPWTTNMMFKDDSGGQVSDIKLIDFQILNVGPPVHDLLCFIWLSANRDVRRTRIPELYTNYFSQLNKNLRTLGCSEVDLACFKDTIRLFAPYALASAAMMPCSLDPAPADLNGMFANSPNTNNGLVSIEVNPFDRYYTESFCKTELPEIMEHFKSEGVFDYLEEILVPIT